MRWPPTLLLLFSMLLATPVEGAPPTFSNMALGTPQDAVLLGRDGVKIVGSDGETISIRTTYKATWDSGDRVSGEEVFHFRGGVLVGGERRIRGRKGRDDRHFFWRTYLVLRQMVAQDCNVELVLHEPGVTLSAAEAAGTLVPYVPGPIWRGEDHWSARCDVERVVTEVRLLKETPTQDTPYAVYSLMKAEPASPSKAQ